MRSAADDCDWLRSVLAGGGTGGVKSLSFLFPNPTNVSDICEGLLAACVSSDGRPLRCVATEMPLLVSSCV